MPLEAPRVLLIAEAANPEWVSVPLIGWSLASAIAKICPAHIVTQLRNRDAFLRAGLREGIDFTAIDTEALAAPIWHLGKLLPGGVAWTLRTALSSLIYPYFERKIWQAFGPALKAGEFQVVHRITPLTPTAPSSLAVRCARIGVPFVVGPINGGVPWPREFAQAQRQEKEWLSHLRFLNKWRSGIKTTWRHASLIVGGSRFTLSEIPVEFQVKCRYMPENGIDVSRFNQRACGYQAPPLRACFVGRLVPYKGLDMALEAAEPFLRDGRLILDVIGDGPMMAQSRSWVEQRGLHANVHLHGWVEHARVQAVMSQSQLLLFPSVREFGGGVVLEAMALGLVPLVVDYAGPGELVDDSVGFKVPIGSRSRVVAALQQELAEIITHPEALAERADKARERVHREFTWPTKAQWFKDRYVELLAQRDRILAAR